MAKDLMTKALVVAAVAGFITFCPMAKADDITPTLGGNSAYTLTKVTASDAYNFTRQVADTQGNLTTEYYQINLNTNNLSGQHTTLSTNPEGATGSVTVQLPNENTPRTLYYTYTKPATYTEIKNTGVTDISIDGVVTDKVFITDGSWWNHAIKNSSDNPDVEIVADFLGYSVAKVYGGAIYNSGTVKSINGAFLNNWTYDSSSADVHAEGGAIYNSGNISSIAGMFIGNVADATAGRGGAISNGGTIGNIDGNFVHNDAALGGAISNGGTIGNIDGNFVHNDAAFGGAISNAGAIDSVTGNFIGNSVDDRGGAIYNMGTISTITGDFIGNYATNNYGSPKGGAIYNNKVIESINGVFIGNYAKSANYGAKGGAIYNDHDGTITFEGTSTFIDNKANDELNGIYNDGNIILAENSTVISNDGINGLGIITLNPNSKLNVNHYLTDQNVELDNATITLGSALQADNSVTYGTMNLDSLTVSANGGTLNAINNNVAANNFGDVTLNGNLNMAADVDLANEVMDSVNATSYAGTGNINVVGMNILKDATKNNTEVFFANNALKDHVTSEVSEVGAGSGNSYQTTAYAPIYKYTVNYNVKDDGGYFEFTKGAGVVNGGSSNPSVAPTYQDLNPAVAASPITTEAAAMSTINQAFNYAYNHSDGFMAQPAFERFAQINYNKTALSTPYNENLGQIDLDHANKGLWVKPYVTFENIPLKHGPKVDAINYGTLLGGDSEINKLKHGWANVHSLYLGYNGSQLKYDGNDSTTNGGLVGFTETLYKGNFFTALTLLAGAGVSSNDTRYGHDNSTFLMAGVGSKTGYNFEFKNGKFIIQPMLYINYSMAKMFDYTNAAGVRINSDPAHNVQINPNVKFIGNFDGWQPYASVGMVWNPIHESDTTANGIKLPEMYTKPYVQYGLGIQRCWADKFSAYGQAMVRNGGRNGISLTAGFRWALGKDSSAIMDKINIKTTKIKTQKQNKKADKNSSNAPKRVIKHI